MALPRNFRQRVPGSREEDAWLSDEQLAQCVPADETDAYGMPIPTQIVSNGEYIDRKSTRLNSSHLVISYAVFCLKKKKQNTEITRNRVYSHDRDNGCRHTSGRLCICP